MCKTRFAVAALLAVSVITSAEAARPPVRFKSGAEALPDRTPAAARQALVQIAGQPGVRHAIVQFDRPVTDAQKARLAAAGLVLLDPLSDNAFFASVRPADLNAAPLDPSDLPSGVGDILPTHRLHPFLLAGEIPAWATVKRPVGEELSEDEQIADATNPVVGTYVIFHPDVAVRPDMINVVESLGGRVRSQFQSINGLVIEIPYTQIAVLAGFDEVSWIEPPLPAMEEMNAENRALTGANDVQSPPYSLTGNGVTVLVYDGGRVRTTHVDFQGRAIVGATKLACETISSHSTHVAGTIGGAGVQNANNRGMATAVNIISYALNQNGGCSLSQGFLYNDPCDIEADYSQSINTYGAHFANNSIGTNTATNGYPCSWEGDYGVTDTVIDAIVRGSLSGGVPFRIVWANGNERQTATCNDPNPNVPAGYHKTAPPACAKNHVTVGATNANDDSMTTFSSWGPADDNRMKPDVSAPGCQVGGDAGVTSTTSTSDTSYGALCGTSMASPTVCGLAALLLQDYRVQFPNLPDFRNSTLKILLAHTAVDRGNPGPDYQFGYGSVRIQPAIDFMRTGNFLESTVSQGGVVTVFAVVTPTDPELKVTLAWDDPPGAPNVSPALVNDLDLVVFDPNNNQRFPWTLSGLAAPAAPATQNQKNAIDNIEQVYVASPPPGVYRIEIRGFNVPSGPQPFSVCASPTLINCSSAGLISLDRSTYNCTGTAGIQVVDCDLNTDNDVIETVTVTIVSTSEPGGETVLLTETGAATAAFAGSIPLSTTNAPGVLLITPTDSLTATYIDADDGQGGFNVPVSANSGMDCVPPVITNIQAVTTQTTATITFTTNEPAKGTLRWGTSCGSLTNVMNEAAPGTAHSFFINGISANTTYYFEVSAEDPAANVTTDDNGGACHTFIFIEPVLTIPFSDDFPTTTFDSGKWASVSNATIDNVGLNPPSPPNAARFNGNPSAGDSIYTWQIDLSGQTAVRLSYAFQVRGGGESPDAGDDLFIEYMNDSGAWVILNQHLGSLPDMTTFQTVQIMLPASALHSGFRLRIRNIGTTGAFDDWFVDNIGITDVNTPEAFNSAVGTPQNTWVNATLQATDPNMDPLTYTIMSLPTDGTLRDPGAGTILSAPYTLVGGGNVVRYTPAPAFLGNDSFTFRASDGANDSNVATVTVGVGGVQPIHTFPLDTNPGWTTTPDWAFGQPTGGGTVGRLDPTSGFTGLNVYGYNLNGHYPNNLTPVRYLTTTAINCTNLTNVSLRFRRWLGVESATFDHANIQASNNGTTWTTIWDHTGAALNEQAWSLQTYSLAAVADNQPTVFIRWGMGTTDGSVTYQGWNIDDVEILGLAPSACAGILRGDVNFDGDINGLDVGLFVNVLLNPGGATAQQVCASDTLSDGTVNLADVDELLLLLLDVPVP